jgi:hypothetical protein
MLTAGIHIEADMYSYWGWQVFILILAGILIEALQVFILKLAGITFDAGKYSY